MKRVLSLTLSLLMLFSVTAGLNITAFAGDSYYETEDNDNYSSADYVPVNSTIMVCVHLKTIPVILIGTSFPYLLRLR